MSRRYQATVRHLQHKISALQALTRAGRNLKAAYTRIAACDPSVRLLEEVRADIELALREARDMADVDDAAVTGAPADGEAVA